MSVDIYKNQETRSAFACFVPMDRETEETKRIKREFLRAIDLLPNGSDFVDSRKWWAIAIEDIPKLAKYLQDRKIPVKIHDPL